MATTKQDGYRERIVEILELHRPATVEHIATIIGTTVKKASGILQTYQGCESGLDPFVRVGPKLWDLTDRQPNPELIPAAEALADQMEPEVLHKKAELIGAIEAYYGQKVPQPTADAVIKIALHLELIKKRGRPNYFRPMDFSI